VRKVDLHIHTTFSDGTYSPEDVVKIAQARGLAAVAITDHDTTDGIVPALKHGAKCGIEVVPGIELSCEYKGTEIHLLGYYINWENNWFQGKLQVFQKARERRAFHILKKLRDVGIDIDERMLFSEACLGSISRLHFARCLIEMGKVSTILEAFQKYLGEGAAAFVPKIRMEPEEGLSLIHRIGGVSVVAHPVYGGGHKSFLRKMKRLGLTAIEAYHPGHTASQTKRLLNTAKDLKLKVTGGTDSHGEKKDENPIGSLKADYKSLESLKDSKNSRAKVNTLILTNHS
jgi:predicted metal-dependent phosphoesterase TrpH